MATSGSYSFNPDIGDIMEEAYERAGLDFDSAYQYRSARRSLDLLTLEWQNKGLNLWTVEESKLVEASPNQLTKGTATYNLGNATVSVLDVILRTDSGSETNQTDYLLNRISEPTYASIPNKLNQARPLQYYIARSEIIAGSSDGTDINSTITFWPTPDESSKYEIIYWRMKRIADTGTPASNTMQVPGLFIPALCAGLAYHVACKNPSVSARVPMLKQIYDETFSEAAEENRVKTSARFVPKISGY